jgi:PIN domain nuclease of toxin-antitoxin system
MNILLDTQFILWIITNGKKIKEKERKIIINSKNNIICSSISFFEISLKYSIGKLELTNFLPSEIPDLLFNNGYQIKDIGYDTFSTYHQLPQDIHKDPFDRILIWEAINNHFHFLTRDGKIPEYIKYGLKIAN